MTRMSIFRRACAAVAGLGLAALGLAAPATAAPAGGAVCHGGSVPGGTYSSLTIAGMCQIDAGTVTVTGSVSVAPNAALLSAFGGSDLHVGQNLVVGSGAIVVLGCEPEAFVCFNGPDLATHDTVGMNVSATDALMMLVHNSSIGGNATQSGGGGGVTCDLFPLGPPPAGPPAYSTWEDNTIGRNATVTGVQTCWLGFIRNTVGGNVNYSDNVLADPDGNEVVTNTVTRNLNCSGNVPAPQVGDSAGSANTVGGRQNGQCAAIG